MHVNHKQIIEIANSYIGIPYRHQGRSKVVGMDCAGLVICVAHDVGISTFDTSSYSRRPNPTEFTREMIKGGCTEIRFDKRQNGDILRIAEDRWPVHSGILEIDDQGEEWLIHAWLPARKVVKEKLTEKRKNQISTVWRYPERN
jgi:hypothetical protein